MIRLRSIRHLAHSSWVFGSAVAVLTTLATTLVGVALAQFIGDLAVPVTIFCPAVMVCAMYGGSRAALLSILLSAAAAFYFFNDPIRTFTIPSPTDQITLLIFVIVGIGIALLAESQRRSTARAGQLASIVESADDAILSKDLDLRITSWNRAAERTFGYRQDEAIGESIRMIIPEDRWAEEDGVMLRIRRGERVDQLETERRHKSGMTIPVLLTVSPVHGATGAVVGASAIVRDLTELKRAEAESQARRVAEEANRAKDAFLAMLSHELGSPLAVILGWVRILKEDQLPPDRAGHALDVIERQTQKQARLVDSLLDLSRIVADKLDLEQELIDLLPLVEDVVDWMRPTAGAKGVTLTTAAVEESLFVIGDSFRLQQVFSNLLTNAIQFTPRGGFVQIRMDRSSSHAQVRIVDNGSGIDPETLPYIFNRFMQTDNAKERALGGLGLGLTIVRELVHAHSGMVAVESRGKGYGSAFTVTLPIPAVIPAHVKVAPAHVGDGEEPSIAGLKILVVDDDHDARELVAVTLGSRGAITRLASSAAEALDLLKHEKPDLMIADIGMPEEDGYALVQTLRAAEREGATMRLPAIALTTHSSPAHREQALAIGFNLHLAKPVAPDDLVRAVATCRK